MKVLKQFGAVRVARLEQAHRQYQGTDGFCRAPRIGDVGTICHEYQPMNPRASVTVECVGARGNITWLADLLREELELVS